MKGDSINKSLVEQILDETFSYIEKQGQFDEKTFQELKQLAATDGLNNVEEVIRAVKPSQEDTV